MKRLMITMLMAVMVLPLSAQRPGRGHNMVEPDYKDVNYAGDNLEAHCLDIYMPKNVEGKPRVVIVIYGSAWFSNNAKGMAYMSIGAPLNDAGFAVVCINHRSSGDAKFPAQIQDVKGAIRFIRANADKYGLDATFIGITGFSSGGHLASLAGVTNDVLSAGIGDVEVMLEGHVGENNVFSSSVDAVVDWFGPVDMSRMQDCSKVKDAQSPEAALIGGNPADMPEMVNLVSPIYYVNAECPRFLVIHGDADNVVPYCQSEYFASSLQDCGRLEEFVTVPNGQHGPVTFNEETFKKMTDFFTQESKKIESMTAEEIMKELKSCGVFYLATVDDDQPHVRPFGALAVYEGRLYLQTGKVKNVYKQLYNNGKFEICAMKPSGTEWIRITGKLVNDDRLEAKEHMLNENPSLKSMYKADDDNTAVLYIVDGEASFCAFGAEPRKVRF